MNLPFSEIILTSAITGAIVSGILALIGQYFDRNARKKELMMNVASDLAHRRTLLAKDLAESTGKNLKLQDEIVLIESYFQWLDYLFRKGKLQEDQGIQRL